jgi:two-component system CheB/CheR fusion protein
MPAHSAQIQLGDRPPRSRIGTPDATAAAPAAPVTAQAQPEAAPFTPAPAVTSTDVVYHLALHQGELVQLDCQGDPRPLTGLSAQELLLSPPLLLAGLPKLERQRLLEQILLVLRQGRPCTIEHRLFTPQGELRWVANTILPLGQPSPNLLLGRGVLRDIGDRRLMLAALADAEDRMQVLLDSSSSAILLLTADGRVVEVNRTAAQMFACQSLTLLGWSLTDLLTEAALERIPKSPTPDATAHPWLRGCEHVEIEALRPNGEIFPAELSITPIPEQRLWSVALTDISERRALQAHVLETAAHEQRRLGQELHDGVGQEVTGLSLMAAALCGMLSGDPGKTAASPEQWGRICDIARLISHRLQDAGRHLRDLAHGIMPVPIDPLGFHAALAELAAGLNVTGGVRCRVRLPPTVRPPSATVATELYRIIQEAVNNALRHGQATRIDIVGEATSRLFRIRVDDNGDGLPDGGEHHPGGFGYQIMQYRAAAMGGAVWWKNRPGGGTRVVCELRHGLEERSGGDAQTAYDSTGR